MEGKGENIVELVSGAQPFSLSLSEPIHYPQCLGPFSLVVMSSSHANLSKSERQFQATHAVGPLGKLTLGKTHCTETSR